MAAAGDSSRALAGLVRKNGACPRARTAPSCPCPFTRAASCPRCPCPPEDLVARARQVLSAAHLPGSAAAAATPPAVDARQPAPAPAEMTPPTVAVSVGAGLGAAKQGPSATAPPQEAAARPPPTGATSGGAALQLPQPQQPPLPLASPTSFLPQTVDGYGYTPGVLRQPRLLASATPLTRHSVAPPVQPTSMADPLATPAPSAVAASWRADTAAGVVFRQLGGGGSAPAAPAPSAVESSRPQPSLPTRGEAAAAIVGSEGGAAVSLLDRLSGLSLNELESRIDRLLSDDPAAAAKALAATQPFAGGTTSGSFVHGGGGPSLRAPGGLHRLGVQAV